MLRSILCCLLFGAAIGDLAFAQPALSHASPAAIRPGQTTEVTLHGSKLDGALSFWSSSPAKIELVPVEADKKDLASRVCKVTLDANAPVGISGMAVANPSGASDVLFVMVDDLPSVADNGGNHALAQAQALAGPSAVDGVCDGSVSDFYKISGKKDQRVSVEVVAARIASTLDPVLRLLDVAGNELQIVDDDPSLGADCRFAFTVPADGEYVIEIRDNQFRAGGRYRLRIGDFPLISAPYPMGGRFGSTMRFKFAGPQAEAASPVFLRLPAETTSKQLEISAKVPGGQSSAMATIVATSLPDLVESEPNNDLKIATFASLPCAVNGTFHELRDRDYFQFAGTKGQSMLFRSVTRSMGSPGYLAMRLLNSEGAQVAEAPVSEAEDASFAYAFPADGMYVLLVEDLLGRGGPEFSYRVEVEPNEGFDLTLKHDANTRTKFTTATNGGAFALPIQVGRRGYEGPIQLAIAEPAKGLTLHEGLIPAGAKEHRVIVELEAGASPGAIQAVRLVGTAQIGDSEVKALVRTLPTLRGKSPQLVFPPAWLDGLYTAGVVPESPPFFHFASSANPVPFSKATGQAQFNVTLERKNAEFKEAISLIVEGLPAGFAAAIKPDKDVYQVTVTGPKEAAKGRQDVRLVGYGEFQGSGRVVRMELPLEVVD